MHNSNWGPGKEFHGLWLEKKWNAFKRDEKSEKPEVSDTHLPQWSTSSHYSGDVEVWGPLWYSVPYVWVAETDLTSSGSCNKDSVRLSHLTGLDILRQSPWLGLELTNRLDWLANKLQGPHPHPPLPLSSGEITSACHNASQIYPVSGIQAQVLSKTVCLLSHLPGTGHTRFWLHTCNSDTWMHQTRTLIPIKKIFRYFQARTFTISLVCLWIWFAKTDD